MDIQEIARLHTRYSEPPLTIEMPTEERATPLLDGPVPTPTAESKLMWARLTEVQRLTVALLVVAGIAFPIGMWVASGGKHDGDTSAAMAQSTAAAATAASAPDAEGHEWPPKTAPAASEVHLADSAEQGSRAASQSITAQANASVASAVAAPAVTVPAPAVVAPAPNKTAAKGPTPASKPAAPTAQTTTATPSPAQAPHAAEPRRNNEIKLF